MRYSREHGEQTRARILAAAGRLFRERGLDGIGVDAVAAAAGVTSGAIYRSFGSKEKLFEAVVEEGVERLLRGVSRLQQADPATWPAALADWYLGADHVGDPGGGCLLPTLSPDVSRGSEAARRIVEEGLRRVALQVAARPAGGAATADGEGELPPAGLPPDWAVLSLLVGAVLLSRAAGTGATGREILEAARAAASALAER